MTSTSLHTAGLLLVTVPTIELGGMRLLSFLTRRASGYADNPLRRRLFRAGHAHAGVLVIFALVGLLYIDASTMGPAGRSLVRTCLVLPPILMPAGFFLSMTSADASRPSRLIWLVYAGAAALAVGTVALGVALLRS